MTLKDWLKQSGKTVKWLAAELNEQPATVYRWQAHAQIPRREPMQAICRLTNGQVTANDFYELPLSTGQLDDARREPPDERQIAMFN